MLFFIEIRRGGLALLLGAAQIFAVEGSNYTKQSREGNKIFPGLKANFDPRNVFKGYPVDSLSQTKEDSAASMFPDKNDGERNSFDEESLFNHHFSITCQDPKKDLIISENPEELGIFEEFDTIANVEEIKDLLQQMQKLTLKPSSRQTTTNNEECSNQNFYENDIQIEIDESNLFEYEKKPGDVSARPKMRANRMKYIQSKFSKRLNLFKDRERHSRKLQSECMKGELISCAMRRVQSESSRVPSRTTKQSKMDILHARKGPISKVRRAIANSPPSSTNIFQVAIEDLEEKMKINCE